MGNEETEATVPIDFVSIFRFCTNQLVFRCYLSLSFPRTVAQAEKLDAMLSADNTKIDSVINFDIADEILMPRITGRLVHAASGRSYHKLFAPPKVPGKDDITGEPLMQRPDDNEATMGTRLAAFHKQTQPVIDYYGNRGVLVNVDADKPSANVFQQIANALGGRKL